MGVAFGGAFFTGGFGVGLGDAAGDPSGLVAVPVGFTPAVFGVVVFGAVAVPGEAGFAEAGFDGEFGPMVGALTPGALLPDEVPAPDAGVADGFALKGTAAPGDGLAAGFAEPPLVAASLAAESDLVTLGRRWARISAART